MPTTKNVQETNEHCTDPNDDGYDEDAADERLLLALKTALKAERSKLKQRRHDNAMVMEEGMAEGNEGGHHSGKNTSSSVGSDAVMLFIKEWASSQMGIPCGSNAMNAPPQPPLPQPPRTSSSSSASSFPPPPPRRLSPTEAAAVPSSSQEHHVMKAVAGAAVNTLRSNNNNMNANTTASLSLSPSSALPACPYVLPHPPLLLSNHSHPTPPPVAAGAGRAAVLAVASASLRNSPALGPTAASLVSPLPLSALSFATNTISDHDHHHRHHHHSDRIHTAEVGVQTGMVDAGDGGRGGNAAAEDNMLWSGHRRPSSAKALPHQHSSLCGCGGGGGDATDGADDAHTTTHKTTATLRTVSSWTQGAITSPVVVGGGGGESSPTAPSPLRPFPSVGHHSHVTENDGVEGAEVSVETPHNSSPTAAQTSASFPPAIAGHSRPPSSRASSSSLLPLDGSLIIAGEGAFFSKERPVKLKELQRLFPPPHTHYVLEGRDGGIVKLNHQLQSHHGEGGNASNPSSPTTVAATTHSKPSSPNRREGRRRSSGGGGGSSKNRGGSNGGRGGGGNTAFHNGLLGATSGAALVSGQGNYGTVCKGYRIVMATAAATPTTAGEERGAGGADAIINASVDGGKAIDASPSSPTKVAAVVRQAAEASSPSASPPAGKDGGAGPSRQRGGGSGRAAPPPPLPLHPLTPAVAAHHQTFNTRDPIAIKVSKIKDKWSFDEVEALRHCSMAATRVLRAAGWHVPWEEEEKDGSGVGIGEKRREASVSYPAVSRKEDDGSREQHDKGDEYDKGINFLLGALRIITLKGQVCYAPKPHGHALWIPLPWLPLTLEGLIRSRVEERGWARADAERKAKEARRQERRRLRREGRGRNDRGEDDGSGADNRGEGEEDEHHSSSSCADGQTLFSLREIQAIFKQLLQACLFLSEGCGVVHLDIKPANVLIRPAGVRWGGGSSSGGGGGETEHEGEEVGADRAKDGSDKKKESYNNSRDPYAGIVFGEDNDDDNYNPSSAPLFPSPHASLVLCDYGLMQHIGDAVVQLGDYLYMAPEVFYCDGKEVCRPKGAEPTPPTSPSPSSSSSSSLSREEKEDEEEGGAEMSGDVDVDIVSSSSEDEGAEDNDNHKKQLRSHKRRSQQNTQNAMTYTSSSAAEKGGGGRDPHTTFTSRSDVWSIGTVMVEVLDGVCPIAWDCEDAFAALKENYLSPTPLHVSRWPGSLVHCILMCFEKDPSMRWGPRELLSHPFFLERF